MDGHHVAGRQAALRHLLRVEPDAHRVVTTAEDLHLAHAVDAGEPVLHIEHRVVAQVVDVVAVVGRDQVHHHRDVGRALDRGHAQAAHLLGQARLGLRDAVLHQLLGLVGVGAQREGHGQRHHAIGGGLAAHVEHAFHAVDGFLQRRGHGFGDHLGVGARVLGAHHHGGRRDFRVFGDRQTAQRDQAAEEDQQRQHPGKDGAVDEKFETDSWLQFLQAALVQAAGDLAAFLASLRSLASSALAVMGTGCGATTAPGRTRCRPLTTMFSPAFRPR